MNPEQTLANQVGRALGLLEAFTDRFGRIEGDLGDMKTDLGEVKGQLAELKTDREVHRVASSGVAKEAHDALELAKNIDGHCAHCAPELRALIQANADKIEANAPLFTRKGGRKLGAVLGAIFLALAGVAGAFAQTLRTWLS